MSRPWISSNERRGIIVILAVIALCTVVAAARRCSVERHSRLLYHTRQASLDSVSAAFTAADTLLSIPDTLATPKPKSRRTSPSAPLPTRNPIDEPVN